MTARLATEDGIAAYRRRGHIGETFHGDLKHNQGIRRLSVRGMPRASGEWTFAAAVRNLRKAITSGHLTPAAIAASPASPARTRPRRKASTATQRRPPATQGNAVAEPPSAIPQQPPSRNCKGIC